jgi:uncharacterized membrane protein YebE (DUF533 family)
MSKFSDILGALVQNGLSNSSQSRMANAYGAGRAGSLGDIVGSLGKMIGGGKSAGGAGLSGRLNDLTGALGNNKAALGGLGALGGALLGGGRSSAKGAIGGGALTMLASVAMSALKKTGQQPTHPPRALFGVENPEHEQELEDDAKIIVLAMINAAKADGAIDQVELQKIVGKLEEGGIDQEEREYFMKESIKPMDLEGVIASADGRADLAAEIYAASLLAIEVDTPLELEYMQKLAAGLGLNAQTVRYIESSLGVQAA